MRAARKRPRPHAFGERTPASTRCIDATGPPRRRTAAPAHGSHRSAHCARLRRRRGDAAGLRRLDLLPGAGPAVPLPSLAAAAHRHCRGDEPAHRGGRLLLSVRRCAAGGRDQSPVRDRERLDGGHRRATVHPRSPARRARKRAPPGSDDALRRAPWSARHRDARAQRPALHVRMAGRAGRRSLRERRRHSTRHGRDVCVRRGARPRTAVPSRRGAGRPGGGRRTTAQAGTRAGRLPGCRVRPRCVGAAPSLARAAARRGPGVRCHRTGLLRHARRGGRGVSRSHRGDRRYHRPDRARSGSCRGTPRAVAPSGAGAAVAAGGASSSQRGPRAADACARGVAGAHGGAAGRARANQRAPRRADARHRGTRRGAGEGEPLQVRFPREHVARAAHPSQQLAHHGATAGGQPLGQPHGRAGQVRRDDPFLGQGSSRAHRRRARPLEGGGGAHGGQAGALRRRLARLRPRGRLPSDGGAEGARLHHPRARARRGALQRPAPHRADPEESPLERHQVHREGPRLPVRRGRPGHGRVRGLGHRDRHRREPHGGDLRRLPAGRRHDQSQVRRNRSGIDHLAAARAPHRRNPSRSAARSARGASSGCAPLAG